MSIYAFISIMSVISFYGCGQKIKTASLSVQELGDNLLRRLPVVIQLASIIYIFYFFLALMCLDSNYIWRHTGYLTDDESNKYMVDLLGVDLTRAILRLISLSGILGAITVMAGILLRMTLIPSTIGSLCILHFIFLLSVNSRSAAFLPMIVLICSLFLNLRGKFVIIIIFSALAIYAVLNGLVGRGSTIQGIAGLPLTFETIFSGTAGSPMDFLSNVTQGILVVAQGQAMRPQYNTLYSWLSLSPLPSLLDGFDAISKASDVRINDSTPNAGITELLSFGFPQTIICLIFIYTLVRLHVKLISRNKVLFVLVNFLIFFTIYILTSYSARGALRYLWLGYYITAFSLISSRRKSIQSGANGSSGANGRAGAW
jgi:hypothetical protein